MYTVSRKRRTSRRVILSFLTGTISGGTSSPYLFPSPFPFPFPLLLSSTRLLPRTPAFERSTDVETHVGTTSSPAPSAPHPTAASPTRPRRRTSQVCWRRGVWVLTTVCISPPSLPYSSLLYATLPRISFSSFVSVRNRYRRGRYRDPPHRHHRLKDYCLPYPYLQAWLYLILFSFFSFLGYRPVFR